VKRILVLTLGWFFIVLGVLGLFLPILQGVLFLVIGLLLLSTEYQWAKRLIEKVSRKYPKVGSLMQKATGFVERLIQKVENLGKKNPGKEKPL
jgi:uncharacterized membrane protein YbaN (DUF454 family)